MIITKLILCILCSNPSKYVLFIFNSHKATMSRLISFVFYFLLYIFLHQGLSTEESGGRRDQQEEGALKEDNRRRTPISLLELLFAPPSVIGQNLPKLSKNLKCPPPLGRRPSSGRAKPSPQPPGPGVGGPWRLWGGLCPP